MPEYKSAFSVVKVPETDALMGEYLTDEEAEADAFAA